MTQTNGRPRNELTPERRVALIELAGRAASTFATAEQARRDLVAEMLSAKDEGASVRVIAEAAGLSHSRTQRLLTDPKEGN